MMIIFFFAPQSRLFPRIFISEVVRIEHGTVGILNKQEPSVLHSWKEALRFLKLRCSFMWLLWASVFSSPPLSPRSVLDVFTAMSGTEMSLSCVLSHGLTNHSLWCCHSLGDGALASPKTIDSLVLTLWNVHDHIKIKHYDVYERNFYPFSVLRIELRVSYMLNIYTTIIYKWNIYFIYIL